MGSRRNHYYYIDRYPMGLDATVFISGGGSKQSMVWTNDTKYPVLIRGINSRSGGTGYMTFVLYSVPNKRKVVIGKPVVKNVRRATDTVQYTKSKPKGYAERIETPHDGMDVWRTVTVYEGGKVLRKKTYYSHYGVVTGDHDRRARAPRTHDGSAARRRRAGASSPSITRMSLDLFLRGLAIGFAVAFALGPIGLLVIRRTIDRGWVFGFVSGLGVATADAMYGAIAAFGLTAISGILVGIDRPMGIVGGAVLLVIAVRSLRQTLAADAVGGAGGTRRARLDRRPARRLGVDGGPHADQPRDDPLVRRPVREHRGGHGRRRRRAGRGPRRVRRLRRLVGAPHRPRRRAPGTAHAAGGALAEHRIRGPHRRLRADRDHARDPRVG